MKDLPDAIVMIVTILALLSSCGTPDLIDAVTYRVMQCPVEVQP